MEQLHLQQPEEFSEQTFAFASQSREHAVAFLNHLIEIAKPFETEEIFLLFIARLATRSWIRGELRLEIQFQDMHECMIRITSQENGAQDMFYENRLCASFTTIKAFVGQPNVLLPLMLQGSNRRTIILTAPPERRRSTLPPSSFMDADVALAEENQRPHNLPDLFAQPGIGDDEDTARYYQSPSIEDIKAAPPSEIPLPLPPPPKLDRSLFLQLEKVDKGWD